MACFTLVVTAPVVVRVYITPGLGLPITLAMGAVYLLYRIRRSTADAALGLKSVPRYEWA